MNLSLVLTPDWKASMRQPSCCGVIPTKERVKKLAAPSAVMAGLDPAIQYHTEFIGCFVDGPVKPGHDNRVLGDRPSFFTRSFSGTALRIIRPCFTISAAAVLALFASAALADDVGCVSTTFRLVGRNDQVCVSAFDDPKVPGVACHISQARTGGLGGSMGLAEDPSRFSISCRQIGPVTADIDKLDAREKVYAEHTSIFFKHTNVFRIVDKKRNTLVYLAISDKLVEGSPQNSISTVPIMPWGAAR